MTSAVSAENEKRWGLVGKPHWPLTTYEKFWGFWHFTGIPLSIGLGMILGPFIIFGVLFPHLISFPISASNPLGLFVGTFPIFGTLLILLGVLGIFDWWQVIHGTIPDPAPWARVLAYAMNEPDPWKEHAELQARLDEAKKASLS